MFIVCNSNIDKTMFAVKDTSDGVVEWYSAAQLDAIVAMGIKIRGYYKQGEIIPVTVTRSRGTAYAGITLDTAPSSTKLIYVENHGRVSYYYFKFHGSSTQLGATVEMHSISSEHVRNYDGTVWFKYATPPDYVIETVTCDASSMLKCGDIQNCYTVLGIAFSDRDIFLYVVKNLYSFAIFEDKQTIKSDYVSRYTLEKVFKYSDKFWQVKQLNEKMLQIDTPSGVFVFDMSDYSKVYGKGLTRESRIGQSRAKIMGVDSDIILENGTARQIVSRNLSWEIPSTVNYIEARAFKLEKMSYDEYASVDMNLFIPNTLCGCEDYCFDFNTTDKTYSLYITVDTNSSNIQLLYKMLTDLSNTTIHWAHPTICINSWGMYRVYLIYVAMLICISQNDEYVVERFMYRNKTVKHYMFGSRITMNAQPMLEFLSGDELCRLFSMLLTGALKDLSFAKEKSIDFNAKAISEFAKQTQKESVAASTYDNYFEFLGLTTWRKHKWSIWFLYEIIKRFNTSEFSHEDRYNDICCKMCEVLAIIRSNVDYLVERLHKIGYRYSKFSDLFRWGYGEQEIVTSRLVELMSSKNRWYWSDTEDIDLLSRLRDDASMLSMTKLLLL